MTSAPAAPSGGLLRSANSLVLSTGASAVLGAVFWVVAARLFDADDVGRDAALLAAMVELSTICQLNLDNVIARFLPGVRGSTARAVASAYGVNAVLALLLGTLFVLAVPRLSHDFAFLSDDPAVAVGFVAGLVLWGVFVLQDSALVAMRHAQWVPVENIAFAALKIAALPLAVALSLGHGVFLAWIVPMALLVVPVNAFIFRAVVPRHRAAPAIVVAPGTARRGLRAFLAQDYLGQVLMRLGVTLLPVLVVATLGATENAYFAIPLTIVMSIDMMILGIATSIVAESAYDERLVREHVVTVIRRFGPPLLAGVAALLVFAPIVLLPFGTDYADHGSNALRLLALACIPRAVIFLAGAVWRLGRDGRRLLGVEAVMLVVLLASVIPLANAHGVTGVAVAWLAAATAAGLLAGAWLLRFLRTSPAPTLETPTA